MTVTPITTDTPACLGIGCSVHADCLRYRLAEGDPVKTIGTCEEQGARPLFVAVVESEGGEV